MAFTFNGAVNGLATLGRWRAYGTAICVGLVTISLIVAALKMFFTKDTTVSVTATVTAADCKPVQRWVAGTRKRSGYYKTSFDCDMAIEYTLNGAKQTAKLRDVFDSPYTVGSTINGRADTQKPTSFSAHTLGTRGASYIVSGFACLLTLFVVCQIFVARSRVVSAAYGAKTVFNIFDPRTYYNNNY